jgi:hypothetical protein
MNTLSSSLLNTELNPICHLLTLLAAHPILHVSRIRVNPSLQAVHRLGIGLRSQNKISCHPQHAIWLKAPLQYISAIGGHLLLCCGGSRPHDWNAPRKKHNQKPHFHLLCDSPIFVLLDQQRNSYIGGFCAFRPASTRIGLLPTTDSILLRLLKHQLYSHLRVLAQILPSLEKPNQYEILRLRDDCTLLHNVPRGNWTVNVINLLLFLDSTLFIRRK